MDAKMRFMLGGIGGLAPVILFLINLDFERYVADATLYKTIGYLVRSCLLFALGGFVAYLHETEKKRITLFLVGVSAPSLLAGYISTANPNLSVPDSRVSTPKKQISMLFSVASAAAGTPQKVAEYKEYTRQPQSKGAEFMQGLLGKPAENVWFVIVGSHLDPEEARKQAGAINSTFKDYHAEVYAPYRDNPYYAVVLGANLTREQAKKLRDQAVAEGFPQDSYYKSYPGLPLAP